MSSVNKTYAVVERIREDARGHLQVQIRRSTARAYTAPPKMPLSLWADTYRFLSPEAAAMPGKWKTANEPMAKGPMDVSTDPLTEKVTIMAAAQLMKSDFILNLVGYYAHGDPCPILLVQPTVEMGEVFSRDRVSPMIRDTPVLRRVFGFKNRETADTILQKQFPGGRLNIVGANAPAGLASRPIRLVCCDEVDRYPASAGKEGDPVGLAEKRTTTFANRLIVLVSTPTVKTLSRIESSYESGDQRRFYVPCPHCGVRQVIEWGGVKWSKDDLGDHDPATAHYECRVDAHDPDTGELGCGKPWSELQRVEAIRAAMDFPNGGWVAAKPFKGHASFHATQLASRRIPLSQVVKEFLEARGSIERLKQWTNTVLAETWEEGGAKADPDTLFGRREPYDAEQILPPEVGLITAGVDIQRDRWECETVGWGQSEESWSLTYKVHYADPSTPGYWRALDEHLASTFRHPTGATLGIETACVDSSDNTQSVYDFCRPRYARRILPIKGLSTSAGKPIWPKKATRNAGKKIDVFLLGLDNAKADTQMRLMLKEPGAGYCHYPLRGEYDEGYFHGLTVEKAVTKYKFGIPYREWHCPDGARNEPWDCRIYAYAALKSLATNVAARLASLRTQARNRSDGLGPAPPVRVATRGRSVRSGGVKA